MDEFNNDTSFDTITTDRIYATYYEEGRPSK